MTSGKRLLSKVAPFARIIEGIAHPHRLAILYILAHEPTRPHDIAAHLPIPEHLIAHHLRAMKESGWVTSRRIGKQVTYTINKQVCKRLPMLLTGTPFWKNTFEGKKD